MNRGNCQSLTNRNMDNIGDSCLQTSNPEKVVFGKVIRWLVNEVEQRKRDKHADIYTSWRSLEKKQTQH